MWVSPFRYLRIDGYLLLPAAFRSLSRLSSALSAKASTLRSFLLDLAMSTQLVTRRSRRQQLTCDAYRTLSENELLRSSNLAVRYLLPVISTLLYRIALRYSCLKKLSSFDLFVNFSDVLILEIENDSLFLIINLYEVFKVRSYHGLMLYQSSENSNLFLLFKFPDHW